MSIFICRGCGHIEFGEAPERCPVCGAPKTSFNQNDNVFIESEEKSKEAAVKHIPAVTVKKECGLIPGQGCVDIIVRIGETVHPMEEAHFIQWIDCYVDDQYVSRVYLTPGVYAAGCFHLKTSGSKVRIVEQCNLHGHWQAEAEL
jgi:superoxide reductase